MVLYGILKGFSFWKVLFGGHLGSKIPYSADPCLQLCQVHPLGLRIKILTENLWKVDLNFKEERRC